MTVTVTERSIGIDWSEIQPDDVDFTCPYCSGSEVIDSELWKQRVLHDGRWKEEKQRLDEDYKAYRIETTVLDKEEPLPFYEWLEEEIWPKIEGCKLTEYEDSARCKECEDGFVYPTMNYAYRVHADFTMENRRKALECGLFLFKHPYSEKTYMSLTGGGMDLSPNILLAYLKLQGHIPLEWALEFRQDYRAYLSKEDHREIAIECREVIKGNLRQLEHKLKALDLFIDNPELLKQKLKERDEAFDQRLDSLSQIEGLTIRGLGALAVLSQTVGDVI